MEALYVPSTITTRVACYAVDVIEGKWGNYNSKAFTFRYAVLSHNGIGSEAKIYYLSVILIHAHDVFSHLQIERARLWHKIGLHRNPIMPQSQEFDQKFVVKTKNSQFAENCLNETMMQTFLQSPQIKLEVNQEVLALFQDGKLQVDSIEPRLEFLSEIATLAEAANEIQDHLKQLEEINPTATESEKISYVNDAVKLELQQRANAAFRAGIETFIDELNLF